MSQGKQRDEMSVPMAITRHSAEQGTCLAGEGETKRRKMLKGNTTRGSGRFFSAFISG